MEYINKTYFKILLNLVEKIENQKGRKNTLSNKRYLFFIFLVLVKGFSWNGLQELYPEELKSDIVKRKFYKWNKNDIFEKGFKILSRFYRLKNRPDEYIIDSMDIMNFNCYKNQKEINFSNKHKSKNAIKLTVIIVKDVNNYVPVYFDISSPRRHDVKEMKRIIWKNNIRNKSIIGDKGYIINRNSKCLLSNKNNVVTPKKKNQSTKNTEAEREMLRQRYSIECLFGIIKRKYHRLHNIKEKKVSYFKSFFSIALGLFY